MRYHLNFAAIDRDGFSLTKSSVGWRSGEIALIGAIPEPTPIFAADWILILNHSQPLSGHGQGARANQG